MRRRNIGSRRRAAGICRVSGFAVVEILRQFVIDILAAADLRLILVEVDTLVAALDGVVEGRPLITKRCGLASVLGLQIGVVACIEANGRDWCSHRVPLVKSDSLDVLIAGEHALGLLNARSLR